MLTLFEILWVLLISIPIVFSGLIFFMIAYGAVGFRIHLMKVYSTACPACGNVLGKTAVEKARKEFLERIPGRKADRLGKCTRKALWRVICPSCDAVLICDFDSGTMNFETEDRP